MNDVILLHIPSLSSHGCGHVYNTHPLKIFLFLTAMKDPRGVLNAHDAAMNMGSVYMIDAFTALLANQREKRSQVYLLIDSGADHWDNVPSIDRRPVRPVQMTAYRDTNAKKKSTMLLS